MTYRANLWQQIIANNYNNINDNTNNNSNKSFNNGNNINNSNDNDNCYHNHNDFNNSNNNDNNNKKNNYYIKQMILIINISGRIWKACAASENANHKVTQFGIKFVFLL